MSRMQRVSRLFQPLRYIAKDTEISSNHQLLLDYGIIKYMDTGMYTFLPLGMRVLNKLNALIDEEMERIDAQKILLPAFCNSKLWKKTDRYESVDTELFKLRDRHQKEYILNPTHEEMITNMIGELGPLILKDLPLRLYQISSKWRDEKKPRHGLLRSREFIMKDLYTFDADIQYANVTYDLVNQVYNDIFNKIGIDFIKAQGDAGSIGGSHSHEYHYVSKTGEDVVLACSSCDYSINKNMHNHLNCPTCQTELRNFNTTEVGHTFLLNTKYSEPLKATLKNHKQVLPLTMGCFGLGISRIITSAIDILSINKQIRWPKKLAPYTVCIIPPKSGSKEASASHFTEKIFQRLCELNIDAIIDDRTDQTIGKRFVFAQGTGYPYIVVVGKMATSATPLFEIHDADTLKCDMVTLEEINDYFSVCEDGKENQKQSGVVSH